MLPTNSKAAFISLGFLEMRFQVNFRCGFLGTNLIL